MAMEVVDLFCGVEGLTYGMKRAGNTVCIGTITLSNFFGGMK